ncbi:MAG: alkaline phosphatase [Prevotellaceae bacterium]|jgi:alkaline phosphatase|nr:alkaline phosphatase [Prevotellaceae bacterium]
MKAQIVKVLCLIFFFGVSLQQLNAQGKIPTNLKQVKNVIMMIPDGTSTSVLSLARWYQSYNSSELIWLATDEIVSGLVKTHSSDAPIGDSAPTGSTFATGVVSQAGYVATYPEKTANDIVPVDATLANTPALTILEAAKLKGMAVGLAFTCEFTHATPADFSSHSPDRSNRDAIAPQMVYNHIDVVFGGGTDYLKPEHRQYLAQHGWDTIFYDYNRFKNFSGTKAWALFAPKDVPYDFDRDSNAVPSLAEMTKKAIETLSKHENGFFLMVEGSKVDFAAHANDPIGIISEYLAFDKAVKEALDFAKKDGQTAIIICPDHGNSAVSIGNTASTSGYNKLSKRELFEPLVNCKLTAYGLAEKLAERGDFDEDFIRQQFKDQMGIDITQPEIQKFKTPMKRDNVSGINNAIVPVINARTFIGFTTGGHTGEDVFLATYHPQGQTLTGTVINTDINRYMCKLLDIGGLADSTKKYFVGHKELFPENSYIISRDKKNEKEPTLTITSNATKKVLKVKAFENQVSVGKNIKDKNMQRVPLKTVAVYVDKNEEFYLPAELKNYLD